MKKFLFISNVPRKITNFVIPSISAAQQLGYEFHMAANFSNFDDDVTKYNITIHHIELERNPFSIKNIKAYRQMINLLRSEKFDVIHCNTPIGGILGRLCGQKEKVSKIIYTAHGFHFFKGASLVNRTIFFWAEKWLASFTDAILTMNQEDFQAAKKFKLRMNGKVYFIPGVGVDTNLYLYENIDKRLLRDSLSLKNDDVILIAMGDLIQRKNYQSSIKAIAKANNPKLHFLICGSGPNLDLLKNMARELGIEKQIHFLGFRKDIKELLAISDIFLFTTFQEGLPRSMMEAMSSGLPCIASNIRGNNDLIVNGKGGYLFDPHNIQGFANAINHLFGNANLRREMGKYNRVIIKDYDVKNVKKKMINIYEEELK